MSDLSRPGSSQFSAREWRSAPRYHSRGERGTVRRLRPATSGGTKILCAYLPRLATRCGDHYYWQDAREPTLLSAVKTLIPTRGEQWVRAELTIRHKHSNLVATLKPTGRMRVTGSFDEDTAPNTDIVRTHIQTKMSTALTRTNRNIRRGSLCVMFFINFEFWGSAMSYVRSLKLKCRPSR